MQQRSLKIIVVFAFFLQSLDLAAQNGAIAPQNYPFARPKGIYSGHPFTPHSLTRLDKFVPVGSKPFLSENIANGDRVLEKPFLSLMNMDFSNTSKTYSPISSNYYAKNLGFFCQKESQFEKMTTIPLRFRVGLIDYVNYLEGKANAIQPRR